MRTLLAAVMVGLILVPMTSALAIGDGTRDVTLEHEVVEETTTSTTEPSTTSTKPSTTTTQPDTTSSTKPTTTTTVERKTASTTRPASTSTTTTQPTTTTTQPATTTIPTLAVAPTTPPNGGLRGTAIGLLADYEGDLMVGLDMTEVDVLGVGITSDFSIAVEAFRAAALWIAVLALMLVAAVLKGVDRKRSRQTIH